MPGNAVKVKTVSGPPKPVDRTHSPKNGFFWDDDAVVDIAGAAPNSGRGESLYSKMPAFFWACKLAWAQRPPFSLPSSLIQQMLWYGSMVSYAGLSLCSSSRILQTTGGPIILMACVVVPVSSS